MSESKCQKAKVTCNAKATQNANVKMQKFGSRGQKCKSLGSKSYVTLTANPTHNQIKSFYDISGSSQGSGNLDRSGSYDQQLTTFEEMFDIHWLNELYQNLNKRLEAKPRKMEIAKGTMQVLGLTFSNGSFSIPKVINLDISGSYERFGNLDRSDSSNQQLTVVQGWEATASPIQNQIKTEFYKTSGNSEISGNFDRSGSSDQQLTIVQGW